MFRCTVLLLLLSVEVGAFLVNPSIHGNNHQLSNVERTQKAILFNDATDTEASTPEVEDKVSRERERFTLFVGNLPFSADDNQVRELFAQNDREVTEVKLITDRDTGRPRGFGFVEMGNSEQADQAIRDLNGHEMDGRQLTVNEARERGGPRY